MSLVGKITDLVIRVAQEFKNLRTEIENAHAKTVIQAAHGFSVNQGIRLNGSAFVLAQADNAENAQIIGMVTEVVNADTFRYQESGTIPGSWTKGVNYFLSVVTPGLIEPGPTYSAGNVRQFVGTGVDDGLLLEIDLGHEIQEEEAGINYTPQVLSGTSPTWDITLGINARISLSGNTSINLINLKPGYTGNLTVLTPAIAYTVSFPGFVSKVAPNLISTDGEITMTGNTGNIDVLSWYYDGVRLIINGTQGYA